MMPRRIALLLLYLLVLLAASAPAAGAASCVKTSLIDIQDEVMCVICGVPLVNAGGPQSDDERNFIRERADKCESKDEIKAALVAEYGPEVLAMPQKKGFDLTAWVLPIVVLAFVLVAIVLGAISWERQTRDIGTTPNDAAAADQLEADLDRYDL